MEKNVCTEVEQNALTQNEQEELKKKEDEQKKAAYSLNMCTVSVSQILDYNDVYVLEQEYDSILNNLNLEVIPKDEALLSILREILNVISFFRVQKIRRDQNDKEYQQRIKNAIWHAIPSFNMSLISTSISSNTSAAGKASAAELGAADVKAALSANLPMMALNIATQVGTGYMNYRREKANAKMEKEKAEVELEIAAIEQLHALQRELFTTAWRMADEYGYSDKWRLTEKQIEQYNQILMDTDDYRKYARLEAIQDKFEAYPAFWYYFAHTALSIATNNKDVRKEYIEKAEAHFKKHSEINRFNLLREDQLAATADLEHADLIFTEAGVTKEGQPNLTDDQKVLIIDLVKDAEEKAGNAFDILQLCAISYLRAGSAEDAKRLLKILVNEGYNAATNAQLLSRLYVIEYIGHEDYGARQKVRAEYGILKDRVDACHLFPMPADNDPARFDALEADFISMQKDNLKDMYSFSIDAFAQRKAVEFNAVLPVPRRITRSMESYWENSPDAKKQRLHDAQEALSGRHAQNYIDQLCACDFRRGYIDILNQTVCSMEKLACFRALDKHDALISLPEDQLRVAKTELQAEQEKLEIGNFTVYDYQVLAQKYSFEYFTSDFFKEVKERIAAEIEAASRVEQIEDLHADLEKFCEANRLPSPEQYITVKKASEKSNALHDGMFYNYELLCESSEEYADTVRRRKSMMDAIRTDLPRISLDSEAVRSYLCDSPEFETYLNNTKLRPSSMVYELRKKAVAIIDSTTGLDNDLILSVDGLRLVRNNKIKDCVPFDKVKYSIEENKEKLELDETYMFSNNKIDYTALRSIIDEMEKIGK